LSRGYQVDGSSGAENTFVIDGSEVTNFRTGQLRDNNNLPFQFVQEVQVKSSGFDAEFGGATVVLSTWLPRAAEMTFMESLGCNLRRAISVHDKTSRAKSITVTLNTRRIR
jgi:hypothetical protein